MAAVERSPDETDTGSTISIAPAYGRRSCTRCRDIFDPFFFRFRIACGIINDFHVGALRQKSGCERFSGWDKRPCPLLCVYLTTEIPSIRDKTTAVKAIIPDLTPIKVIIVFLICNAKSAKPDQYINTIKLDRCGPSIRRLENTCMTV